MQKVSKDTVNYHVSVAAAAYFEAVWDSLHLMLSREDLGAIHTNARKKVATELDKANRDFE